MQKNEFGIFNILGVVRFRSFESIEKNVWDRPLPALIGYDSGSLSSSFEETSPSVPEPESSKSFISPSGTEQTPQITNEIKIVGKPTG